ncbi:hypothetical protein [Amycolatopsis nigrescens]|uniref:hypothetical protein n=1 Tax=Amycolatopsis nigrescens TaxID=381445 RepID=UPI0003758B39|nr:hypothetical protein [Amycolatopsis nigrescens]
MSTPDLLSTDPRETEAATRREEITRDVQILTGAALAAGGLTWITFHFFGTWVLWTVFLLGAVTSSAAAVLLDLAGVLLAGRRERRG